MHCSGWLQSPFLQPVLHNATKNKEIRCELGAVHIKLRWGISHWRFTDISFFLIPFLLLKRNNFSLYAHLKLFLFSTWAHGRQNFRGAVAFCSTSCDPPPPLQTYFAWRSTNNCPTLQKFGPPPQPALPPSCLVRLWFSISFTFLAICALPSFPAYFPSTRVTRVMSGCVAVLSLAILGTEAIVIMWITV